VGAIGMQGGECHISGFSALFSAPKVRASSDGTTPYKKISSFLYCSGLILKYLKENYLHREYYKKPLSRAWKSGRNSIS
jgi:hypothetical protein